MRDDIMPSREAIISHTKGITFCLCFVRSDKKQNSISISVAKQTIGITKTAPAEGVMFVSISISRTRH
jgi:hypothetical protein